MMMKYFLKSVILLFSIFNILVAQSRLLNLGDTIYSYLANNPVKFKKPVENISSWVEGKNLTILTYQTGIDSTKPNFLSSKGVAFGVLQGKNPNAYFLFDTDGDGTLDYRTNTALLPIWLVNYTSKIYDSSSMAVTNILDTFYNAFQSDSGLVLNHRTKPAFDILTQCAEDTLFPNRDLVYQLWYYIIMTTRDPSQALMAMKILEETYTQRFLTLHPLIKLYELESSIQLNKTNIAKIYLRELQNIDPDFIPGKYYAYILEADSAKKLTRLNELKMLYPNHWIINKIKDTE